MSAAVHDEGRYPMSVHEKSQGYHSGARDYVAGRPGYPPGAIEWLRDVLGAAPGRKIVEIGAGTGKFIPTLQEVGGTIIAVEPITEMREQLVQSFPDVTALAGSADAIPLPDASVDAVVCAQAFHWFATIEAVAEMRRVLVPAGGSVSSGMGGTRAFRGLLRSPRSPIAVKAIRRDTAPVPGGRRSPLRASSSSVIGTCATTILVRLNRSFLNAQCR